MTTATPTLEKIAPEKLAALSDRFDELVSDAIDLWMAEVETDYAKERRPEIDKQSVGVGARARVLGVVIAGLLRDGTPIADLHTFLDHAGEIAKDHAACAASSSTPAADTEPSP